MPYRILCFFTGGGYYEEAWKKVLDILLKEYTEREREALQVSNLIILEHFYEYQDPSLHAVHQTEHIQCVKSLLWLGPTFHVLQVLSLESEASLEQITHSYRELAKTWHPDHNPSKEAEAMFVKIHEAYEVLLRRHRPNRFK